MDDLEFDRELDRELIELRLEQGEWEALFTPDDGP